MVKRQLIEVMYDKCWVVGTTACVIIHFMYFHLVFCALVAVCFEW